jgi:hypothetical protein
MPKMGKALRNLSDVNIPLPSDGQVLTWDAATGKWIAQSAAGGGPTIVRKTADEELNFGDTLHNDAELFFTVGANEVWNAEIFLQIGASATFTLMLGFSYPPECKIKWNLILTFTLKIPLLDENETPEITCIPNGDTVGLIIKAIITNGANAGSVGIMWVGEDGTTNTMTIKANSYIVAHKLG